MTAEIRNWYDDLQWRDAQTDYMNRRGRFGETGLQLDLLKVQDALLDSDLALHFRDAMATITAERVDGCHGAGSLARATLKVRTDLGGPGPAE